MSANENQDAVAAFQVTLALLKVFLSDPLDFEDLGMENVEEKPKRYGNLVQME